MVIVKKMEYVSVISVYMGPRILNTVKNMNVINTTMKRKRRISNSVILKGVVLIY